MNSYTHHRVTCLLSLRNVGPILHTVFPEELVVLIIRLISVPQFFDPHRLLLAKNPATLSEDNTYAVWEPQGGYCYQSCFAKVAVPLDASLDERDFYSFTILFESTSEQSTYSTYSNIGWVAIGFVEETKMCSAITHMSLGHGFYCLSNNGHSWKSDRNPSNLLNGFTWANGDIVSCVYDGKIQTITMRKLNSTKSFEEVCVIDNVPNQGKILVPVVLLHSAQSSAKILKPGQNEDWYNVTKQRTLEKLQEQKKELEKKIEKLECMGFLRKHAEMALKVKASDLESSVEWLIQGNHVAEDEEEEGEKIAAMFANKDEETESDNQAKISLLTDMGFDAEVAIEALRVSDNNVEQAITHLFQ